MKEVPGMTDTAPAHIVESPMDAKGRLSPEHMTDRALLVELVTHMRVLNDTVEEFSESPMVKSMTSGGSPLAALGGMFGGR